MTIFSICICVCLDNDENVFHVYLCVFRQRFVCLLDNDENVFHVYLGVFYVCV